MIRVPPGMPGLPQGTNPSECDQPVSLLSLFPTLLDLAGLPADDNHDGPSLVPLLRDAAAEWPHVAVTHLGDPGSYGLSARQWRLIHYANGDEELYHIEDDPHEWDNLALRAEFRSKLDELRSLAPQTFADKKTVDVSSLPKLPLHPFATLEELPKTQPRGIPFALTFVNESETPVRLFWVNPRGERIPRGGIASRGQLSQRTRTGVVWLVTDAEDTPLGYFHVETPAGYAVIPSADR